MKKIVRSFSIVFIMTILAKIASFISEMVIAYILGTGEKADAYSMIIGIHQVIYPMLGVGIWSIFLPMYKKKIVTTESKEAEKLLNKVLTLFMIIALILIVIINVFANGIINIIANGFSDELKVRCAILLRIYSPYFLFVIISSIYAAVLQSHDKFLGSQIREVATYLPTIFLGPLLYKLYDVEGLVVALVIGSIFRLVVLVPFLKKNLIFKLDFKFKDSEISLLIRKMPSVLITSAIEQLNTLIDKVMASSLTVGAVSSLSYGNKLINAFNGMFTSAISTTVYPTLSKLYVENKKNEMKLMIERITLIEAIIVIPLSGLMILLKNEIVCFAFGRGAFNQDSINITAATFMGYLIGMYYIGAKSLINNVFYSMGYTKKIMKISFVTIICNIVLNVVFVKFMGVVGLAIASSIASIMYFILTNLQLNKMGYVNIKKIVLRLGIIYLISAITYIINMFIKNIIDNNINYIVLMVIISISFFLTYSIFIYIIKFDESKILFDMIMNKIKRREKRDE